MVWRIRHVPTNNLPMRSKLAKKIILEMLGKMQHGRLDITDEAGRKYIFGQSDDLKASMKVNSDEFYLRVLLYGDIGFGEAYMHGLWETDSITDVITFMIANNAHLPTMSGFRTLFSPINLLKVLNRIRHLMKPNSVIGARKNIAGHYVLSNEFFQLFLDPTMTYSCGYFEKPEESLKQAQVNKYDRLCREVRVREGDRILEIGCGWGGFAIHAAGQYNCEVTAITISRQQFEFARARVEQEGLKDRVDVRFQDYRKVTGKFDRIISIEMIEAVGHRYFTSYFSKINELLKPDGILGLQAIIIPDSRYDEYRKSVDWLQKHIFPGGLLPSVARINTVINEVGDLNLYGLKEMGLSYANTLRNWYGNFKGNMEKIKSLGFDDVFLRKWAYYLCCCEASFLQRNINVVQMIYARPNNPTI